MSEKRHNAAGEGACGPKEDILAAYVRAKHDSAARAALESHCRSCEACNSIVESFKRVEAHLSDVPAPARSRDLAPAILARIPEGEWAYSARWFDVFLSSPRLARAAAGVALLLSAAGILVYGIRHVESERPVVAAVKPSPSQPSSKHDAIAGGLAWLAAHQEADGSWSAERWGAKKEHTVGITALSLLAFIGKDPDTATGPYAESVRRGIGYLLGQQDAGGRIGPVCANAMYNHGMATVALLRSMRLDGGGAWKEAGERAVGFVCAAQKESGGWGYQAGNNDAPNTSVTIWQLQALMLADAMGNHGLVPRIERSMTWLRGMVDANGRMGYSSEDGAPNGQDALTAAGVLCLLSGDSRQKDNEHVAQLVRSLEASARQQGKTLDYYRWYFVTHALQAAGGEESKEVAGQLQETLIAQQAQNGPGAGSWELGDRWTPAGGRIYTTSMAVLSLE